MSTELPAVLDSAGASAPPRRNGSLVFAEPWERRLFGVTMALHEAGCFEWEAFRQHLIDSIASWEADHPGGDGYHYYEQWLSALQSVLSESELVSSADLHERVAVFAARPAGHDHAPHDVGHDSRQH
jgi:nitrile hydratase accessory protein